MKKIVLATLLSVGILSADILGQAGLGYSRGDNGANHITAFAGVDIFMGAGVRLEYTKNITEHPEFSKEDVSRYGLFATYQFSMIPMFAITPKVGIIKTDGEFTAKDALNATVFSKSSTEFTYGLEIDYYYNSFISIFLGYTDYGKKLDINNIKIDTSKMDTANYTLGFKIHL